MSYKSIRRVWRTRNLDPRLKLLSLGLLVLVILSSISCVAAVRSSSPGPVRTQVDVVFWDSLAPFGTWEWIEVHGWIWIPNDLPVGWHPYTYGHWVYSSYGWTWVSTWEWGWAPFHYGRWLHHPRFGWIWKPGSVWAPAWVEWRFGGGWIGWAPLPPGARWNDGLHWSAGISIGIDGWIFVPDRHFTTLQLREHILPGSRDAGLLDRTRVVTRFETAERGSVRDRGLDPGVFERQTGVTVPRVKIEERQNPPPTAAPRPRDGRLEVYRPPLEQKPGGDRKPARKKPGRGRG
ncbi:MAG: DUF6600 domain-containing protein [Acidobacteriota bacterium]|nr:DUF6600 domain-containing protein [Acidobacteriota bacterium]